MAAFTLEEIVRATGGELLRKGSGKGCTDVSTDTRSIEEGDLFIPLIGENFDGHRFLAKAAAGGASCVLVSERGAAEGLPAETAVIEVADTKKALEELARFHRLRFDISVIGITGSNGKTTTKDMVTAVLSKKYAVCHTEKNFNNEIGLSKTLLGLTEAHGVAVVEMGMRGFGEIAELSHIAQPTIGIVTNVGTSHIGILGSREGIAKAKGELIDALAASGTAILNYDDDLVRKMGERFTGRVISYSTQEKAVSYADGIAFLENETDFRCHVGGESTDIRLPLLGIHNVYDALAAASAGALLGVSGDEIREALEAFEPQGDRQKIVHVKGATVFDDSYNASPLSVEMAFLALRQLAGKRYILILGDMLELGTYEDEQHYGIGKKAADMGFDELVTVGTLSRMTAKGAAEHGMKKIRSFADYKEAAEALAGEIGEGDVILIKGSHAMQMEKITPIWKGENA